MIGIKCVALLERELTKYPPLVCSVIIRRRFGLFGTTRKCVPGRYIWQSRPISPARLQE